MYGNAPNESGVTMYDFTLFKHRDGRSPNYYCLYTNPCTGKLCHFSCKTSDENEAYRFASGKIPETIRSAFEERQDGKQSKRLGQGRVEKRSETQHDLIPITVGDFAAKYIAEHRTKRGRPLKEKSRKAILDSFNQFTKQCRHAMGLDDEQEPYLHAITIEMCRLFILSGQSSDRSAQKHYMNLRAAFDTAVKVGYIGMNFFHQFIPPTPEYTDEEIDARCFTDEEFAVFVRYMPMETFADRRLRNMLVLASETGLRLGELRHVKESWLDLSQDILRVQSDKDFSPKTKFSSRTIPLSNEAIKTIEAQLQDKAAHRREAVRNSPYLFPNELGLPISEAGVENPFRELRNKVFGLHRKPTIHGLRHAFVTRLITGGAPLPFVQSVSGHETNEMTKRYTHITFQAIEPVRDILNRRQLLHPASR